MRLTDALPELVSGVECLLFNGENDRAQILVIGEIVPMLCSVEVFLVRFLFHAR